MGKLQHDVLKAVTRGCIDKQTATADEIAKDASFQTVNAFVKQYIETHRRAIAAVISEPFGASYAYRWNAGAKKLEVLYCLNSEELIKALDMISVNISSNGIYEKHEYLCWIGRNNSYNMYNLEQLKEYGASDPEHDDETYEDGRKITELSFADFRFSDK